MPTNQKTRQRSKSFSGESHPQFTDFTRAKSAQNIAIPDPPPQMLAETPGAAGEHAEDSQHPQTNEPVAATTDEIPPAMSG